MWQTASDFIVFIGWLWSNLILLAKQVFLPITYIFTYIKTFFVFAFATPETYTPLYTFSANVKSIFASIPYFSTLFSVALLGLTIVMVVFIFKTFLRV
jgi:hypothetical protein